MNRLCSNVVNVGYMLNEEELETWQSSSVQSVLEYNLINKFIVLSLYFSKIFNIVIQFEKETTRNVKIQSKYVDYCRLLLQACPTRYRENS